MEKRGSRFRARLQLTRLGTGAITSPSLLSIRFPFSAGHGLDRQLGHPLPIYTRWILLVSMYSTTYRSGLINLTTARWKEL